MSIWNNIWLSNIFSIIASSGHKDVVQELLKRGANIKLKTHPSTSQRVIGGDKRETVCVYNKKVDNIIPPCT